MTVRMTGGKASEFRGRGLASGAWMGGRGRGRLKGHGVVRSGVNLDGVGVNPGESESYSVNQKWRVLRGSPQRSWGGEVRGQPGWGWGQPG